MYYGNPGNDILLYTIMQSQDHGLPFSLYSSVAE
jgi:hypothetical protein